LSSSNSSRRCSFQCSHLVNPDLLVLVLVLVWVLSLSCCRCGRRCCHQRFIVQPLRQNLMIHWQLCQLCRRRHAGSQRTGV
jgi:hypothetical protein